LEDPFHELWAAVRGDSVAPTVLGGQSGQHPHAEFFDGKLERLF
jgi:hypothetical protein